MADFKYYVGIDIGSTAAKTVVLNGDRLQDYFTLPTGWNGKETSEKIYEIISKKGYSENMRCVSTGYGRACVAYADKQLTEISCHGRGANSLFQENCLIVDIGGQDTKIIRIENGQVIDFLMNDKCAAGTGKFIEVMAERLGGSLEALYELAKKGKALPISSMCTVFAESEVIGHIGSGKAREDIAAGVIASVAERVAAMVSRYQEEKEIMLTGGLCQTPYFIKVFEEKTRKKVITHDFARYAGALGAALVAADRRKISIELQAGVEP